MPLPLRSRCGPRRRELERLGVLRELREEAVVAHDYDDVALQPSAIRLLVEELLAEPMAPHTSEAAEEAGRRDTLAAAATAYLELSRSAASVVAAADSLRIADGFLGQVRQAVEAGLAFAGDVQRAEVQRERTETLRLKAVEDERVASVRLAQLLRLPPLVALRPDLGEFVPVALVATNRSLESLVAAALGRRPELQRAEAQVAGARAGQR